MIQMAWAPWERAQRDGGASIWKWTCEAVLTRGMQTPEEFIGCIRERVSLLSQKKTGVSMKRWESVWRGGSQYEEVECEGPPWWCAWQRLSHTTCYKTHTESILHKTPGKQSSSSSPIFTDQKKKKEDQDQMPGYLQIWYLTDSRFCSWL